MAKNTNQSNPNKLKHIIFEVKGNPLDSGNLASSIPFPAANFFLELDKSFSIPLKVEKSDMNLSAAQDTHTILLRGAIKASDIEKLSAHPNVLQVYDDGPVDHFDQDKCAITPCDCNSSQAKGTLEDVRIYLGVDKIWEKGHKGQGIVVGIVDGGISAQNRVEGGKIPNVISGYPEANWGKQSDWNQHGNMTATDLLGIAPEVAIYDIRITGRNSSETISNALAAYQWAINKYQESGTPHILSNSWGLYNKDWAPGYATNPSHPLTRKIKEAIELGMIVLFAAGNCGGTCASSRCNNEQSIWGANGHPLVMTVGAANIKGEFIGYSSNGPAALDQDKPDFCGISHFKGYYDCDSGTSAACPVVAGVVALLKQSAPRISSDSIKAILRASAEDIGPEGWDLYSGSGIIKADKAFDLLNKTAYVS